MTESINWRDQILSRFLPQVAPLSLVIDPDCLLTEEQILQSLQEQGYEVFIFQDPIEFRFLYESQYRDRLGDPEPAYLIVVLQLASHSFNSLPYDLLQAGQRLSFSLAGLLPNLSYGVVKQLDLSCLDRLYPETIRRAPKRLGDNSKGLYSAICF